MTYVRNKATYVMSRLYPLICKRNKISLRNKLTLYKTYIRFIMTYACVVFAHTKIDLLQRDQNNSSVSTYTKRFWIRIVKEILQSYQYAPHPHPLLRCPRSVLLDLDDLITAANRQDLFLSLTKHSATVRGDEASSISRHVRASARRGPML